MWSTVALAALICIFMHQTALCTKVLRRIWNSSLHVQRGHIVQVTCPYHKWPQEIVGKWLTELNNWADKKTLNAPPELLLNTRRASAVTKDSKQLCRNQCNSSMFPLYNGLDWWKTLHLSQTLIAFYLFYFPINCCGGKWQGCAKALLSIVVFPCSINFVVVSHCRTSVYIWLKYQKC